MSSTHTTSYPGADAFYAPADTCRQARLWLPWPKENALQTAVAAVVHAAAAFQPVVLAVAPGDERKAREICGSDISEMMPLALTSLRLRDTGPTFLVDGKGGSAAIDWRFNGWGRRDSEADASLAHALLGAAEVRRFRAPLTLESSSIIADGQGTILALAAAAFDPARNPGLAPLEAFGIFQDWLGAARVIWIADAHPRDRLLTDARALVNFVAPGLVAVTAQDTIPALHNSHAHLARARDAQGKTLELLRLPAAGTGEGLMSYTSYLPVNGGLLVPAFDCTNDNRAADMLAEVFAGRDIRMVPARTLAAAGISLSALALPHPARLLERDRATILPRSAWSQATPDADAVLQHYIELAERER